MLLRSGKYSFASLREIYGKQVVEARKTEDPVQVDAIKSLQRLHDDLVAKHESWKENIQKISVSLNTNSIPDTNQASPAKKQASSGFFDQFFSSTPTTTKSSSTKPQPKATLTPSYVKGLYLWGASGCGKTYLSQMFFNNLPIKQKKKVHFHEFMANIHKDLFLLQREKKTYDPMITIAYERAKESRLLFLDEFQVTDVADATMLKRLFEKMILNGMVLLATSNREPQDLYKNGIQREHFVPFIHFLREHCEVKEMRTADYRYLLQSDPKYSYLHPINEQTDAMLDQMFIQLTKSKTSTPQFKPLTLEAIAGRNIVVPRSNNGVCMYYFDELCRSVMGDSDFRAICRNHKAMILKHIPAIDLSNRSVANRFIKLLDEIYNNKVKLYCNAETSISQLTATVQAQDSVVEQEFAINRCKSRLAELQSKQYKETPSFWEVEEGEGNE